MAYLATLNPAPAEMEAAYLEYRRACTMILWRHARDRNVLDMLAEPKSVDGLSEEMGFRPERKEHAELMLEALVRFGAVTRDGAGQYQAVDGFAPAEIDQSVLPLAISAAAVEDLMHSDTFRGMVDTLQIEENAAAAHFNADHMKVWTEFLGQPFYEYSRWAAVTAVATRGAAVLDLGCGPGLGLRELAEAVGAEGAVTGVEVSPDFVEEAKRRTADLPQVRVVHGDLDQGLPESVEGPFDGAILVGAMHFLTKHDLVLGEVARVLRQGGRLSLGYVYLLRGSPDQELMDLRFAFRVPRPRAVNAEMLVATAEEQGLRLVEQFALGCFGWFLFERVDS